MVPSSSNPDDVQARHDERERRAPSYNGAT
jgi:hypothetical protein